MNSLNLERILNSLVDPDKCKVLGVFPSDLIPAHMERYPICFIANTDPSSLPGQHWVAYYFDSELEYEFFDSYGYPPDYYSLPYSSPSIFNVHSLQSNTSAVCGQFCLYYLNSKARGSDMKSIIHSFSLSNKTWNDKFVRKFVSQITLPKRYYNTNSSFAQISDSFIHFKRS